MAASEPTESRFSEVIDSPAADEAPLVGGGGLGVRGSGSGGAGIGRSAREVVSSRRGKRVMAKPRRRSRPPAERVRVRTKLTVTQPGTGPWHVKLQRVLRRRQHFLSQCVTCRWLSKGQTKHGPRD